MANLRLADLMSRPTGVEKSSYAELHEQIMIGALVPNTLMQDVREYQTEEFLASCNLPEETMPFYYEGRSQVHHNYH